MSLNVNIRFEIKLRLDWNRLVIHIKISKVVSGSKFDFISDIFISILK